MLWRIFFGKSRQLGVRSQRRLNHSFQTTYLPPLRCGKFEVEAGRWAGPQTRLPVSGLDRQIEKLCARYSR